MIQSDLDIKGAYLNSWIPNGGEVIYVLAHTGEEWYLLQKYIYGGLKQADLEWNKLLTRTMLAAGYNQSLVDPCVFSKWLEDGSVIIMMDDFYVISNSQIMLQEWRSLWTREFKERDHRAKLEMSSNIWEWL
jgi:hypothetical protein